MWWNENKKKNIKMNKYGLIRDLSKTLNMD